MHHFYRIISVCFLLVSLHLQTKANVSIVTTGGSNISADKASGSVSPAYTTLTNIGITNLAADFTTTGSATLILTAPANWQFLASAGTATGSGNVTVTGTVVTATTITITYSAGANSTSNAINITGIQVQGLLKTAYSGNITRTGGTGTIAGLGTGTVIGALTQVAGAYVKLQVLVPGETAAPGTATGKTGTPSAIASGTSLSTVTVNAVDANWNKVLTVTDVVGLTSNDANATLPANGALAAGTKAFSTAVTLRSISTTTTITASNITDPTKTANTSPNLTVAVGAFTKLQILLPGETAAPGTATGKTGTPTVPVAGTAFNITVNAVDAGWNVVTSATDVVGITSTDAYAVLPSNTALAAGTVTLSVTLKTAAVSKTITASDITTPAKTANTSPGVTASTGTFSKLQILLPGETAAPGTATGKTGTPTARAAGTAFSITVNAVDAYWNKITTATDMIQITTTDANGVVPSNTALVAGTKTFSSAITLKTPGTTTTITATDVTDNTKTADTSPATTVDIGSFSKLQLLLPGETAAPGTATGKTGTPTVPVAGTPFNITVNAVDAAWNVTTSATDVVKITSTDINAALPPNAALAAGTATLSFTFKTSGSRKITASDVTTTSKTASTSPSLAVVAGAYVKLQLLVPGETAAAGTPTGKTGTPTAASAGTAFTVIVNAVDDNWNKVTTVTDMVQFATTDSPLGIVPASAALVAGTKTFTNGVNLKTPGSHTVTVTDAADNTKMGNTSPTITVNLGSFAKLQLLLPGETAAPGTATGKTGTPTAPVAGTSFNVTVNAVDAAWNLISSATDVVSISSNDLNATLPANAALVAGTKTFSFTFKTATTTRTITATDVTNGAKTANTSPSVTVAAGAYAKLQVLLPGETAVAGSADGKSGSANPPARGTAFNIIVNAVDANFNKVTSVTNTVTTTSTDGGATLPAATALVAGTKTLSVKIVSNNTSPYPTLTVTDAGITTTVTVPGSLTPTATTDYFRTKASGTWNDASIWESSTNGTTNWQVATLAPTSAANVITISNTDTVTVSASVSVDQVVLTSNAIVSVNSGVTLTIASGGSGTPFDVFGTLKNSGTITTTGALVFESGGKYIHNFTSTLGVIPTATWNNLSTCEINSYTSATGTLSGGGQTFGNFIWNCPGQNVAGGIALGGTASINNLTITATGTGNFQFGAVTNTVTVRGNFEQTSGNLILNNNASNTTTLNLAGDFKLSGGTIQKGSGTNLIAFNGTAKQSFIKTGGTISGAVNFIVNNAAILDFGDYILDGSSGTFTVAAGGTILTNNDLGFTASGATGAIQNAGTRTYSTTANYTFNGTSAQIAGSGLPTTVNNLTINNPDGVTLPAGAGTYTVNGQLNLSSGNLDLGQNTLVVGSGFSTAGTGTLKTQSTATLPIPSGKTWTVGVEYNGTSAQNVVPGTYANLTFSEAGTKTTAAGTLAVTGNWSSSDGKVDLLTNNTDISFTGTTQSLSDDGSDGGNGILFKNVTFGNSGTKTLSAGAFSVSSQGLLTMSGTATLAANGKLTLLSDATGTGSIGPLTGGAAVTGNVNVQAFITGDGNITNRGYRLLSSPVSVAAAANSYYDFSYLRGTGTLVTGAGGSSKGFDQAGNPTLYMYREDKKPETSFTSGNFRAITAINNSPTYNLSTIDGDFNMPVGSGFMFFFRGNGGTNPLTPPTNVVLSTLGTVNQGQIMVKNWVDGTNNLAFSTVDGNSGVQGYNLVGNPYPSSIDWNTAYNGTPTSGIYAPNTDQTIYIYNTTSKTYATYLNTSATTGVGVNGGSRIIPSGQGFFVHATSAGAQLVFNESAKVNAHPGTLLLNAASTTKSPQIRLQLAKDSISKDENVFVFNETAKSSFVKNEDALYLKGSGAVSLSHLSTDNRRLAINQLPFPKKTQNIPLNVAVTSTGNYQLRLTELTNIPEVYDIWLKDNYTSDSLDIKHNTSYVFKVTGDTASTGANRFKLVLRPNPALAVSLLNFTASKDAGNVKISWTAENESNHTRYTLERSTDGGKTFVAIDSLTSINLGTYQDLDPHPAIGQNQYRLKQVDVLGNLSYSAVVKVMYTEQSNNQLAHNIISLYPNPASVTLNVAVGQTGTAAAANYKITVTNNIGLVVRTATSAQANWQGDISTLLPGTYFVQVLNVKDNTIVGRSTFIKL